MFGVKDLGVQDTEPSRVHTKWDPITLPLDLHEPKSRIQVLSDDSNLGRSNRRSTTLGEFGEVEMPGCRVQQNPTGSSELSESHEISFCQGEGGVAGLMLCRPRTSCNTAR